MQQTDMSAQQVAQILGLHFSAHHINDKTTLQIIDVQLGEAEWCLKILEALFDHFYVAPATHAKKKAELDAKLKAAGKPPSK
jgi:hypothetical protein